MGEKLGEALLDLDTDDKKFRGGVDRAERRAQQLGRTFDDVARRAMFVGKAMAGAAAVGGAAFGVGLASAIKRLEEMKKLSAQVDRALMNSGNAAQTSSKEIGDWADALEERTGRAAEEVMAVSANLATYGFGQETFFRAIELANDMSAAWGGDLKQNIEGLGRALDDPINGMAMLSKRGIKLTDEQKRLAQSFMDTGQKAKAQEVVFEALEAQVKGVAEAGFGGLSKAIALAQKRWEDAFEDLVTGKGAAGDLRDTLIELADTLSSKEFIDAAMGFGSALVDGIDKAAKAVMWTWGKVQEFLAWLNAQQPANMSSDTLEKRIADQKAAIAAAEAKLNGAGGFALGKLGYDAGGFFGTTIGAAEGIKNLRAELARLQAELGSRASVNTDQVDLGKTFDQLDSPMFASSDAMWGYMRLKGMKPPTDGGGAAPQSDALKRVLEDLRNEAEMVGLDAQQQAILTAQRKAGVSATSEQGKEIANLIKGTDLATTALERQQEAYELLGDIGRTALDGLIDAMKDGKLEGQELLGILGDVLKLASQYFLKQAFGGMGQDNPLGTVLSGIFSGFHAKGGLIPNGQFGIVGERGPEPVIGTPRGAMVLPNSSLGGMGGGVRDVIINGSGLSQSELTQAISDAIGRFSRFELPGRVRDINADPLARG